MVIYILGVGKKESRSSSSCNSSEPNSPNYFKHQFQSPHYQPPHQTLNNPVDSSSNINKKSSSSSISSASIGYYQQPPSSSSSSSQLPPQPSPSLTSSHHFSHHFPLASTSSTVNTLTPIQSIDTSGSVDTNVTLIGANEFFRRNPNDTDPDTR